MGGPPPVYIAEALQTLARGEATDLSAYFHCLETDIPIAETNATAHIHCVKLDGNGRPRTDALIKHLVEAIIDYAIPRSRIAEANEHFIRTKSTSKMVALNNEARGLFTRLQKSGEGGELLLFLLAEKLLGLPQILCKMSLKTSSEMHFHGSDALHLGAVDDKLCLYWGESKLFATASSAISACFKSIAPILLGTGGGFSAEERDLQLLRHHLNVDNPPLESALKGYLDPDDPRFNQLEFRGLCLVGFDSHAYPTEPNSATLEDVCTALSTEIPKWKEQSTKHLALRKVETFHIHTFYIPLQSVEAFRATFGAMLKGSDGA